MPPWIMCDEAADAPLTKSPRSTSTTSTPCSARSRNVAMPLMPPPMTTTSAVGRARIAATFGRVPPPPGPASGEVGNAETHCPLLRWRSSGLRRACLMWMNTL